MVMSPPGFEARLGDLMKRAGFSKDDRPDVGRFCTQKGYRPQYVYAWLRGRTPTFNNLERLAKNFDVPVAWLMFGDDGDGAASRSTQSALARKAKGAGVVLTTSRQARHDGRPRRTGRMQRDGRDASATAILDFGRLRAATEQVLELQAELETFLEAFPDLIMWLDVDGTVLDCKTGSGPGLAVSPRARGSKITDAMPGAAGAALQRGLAQALKTNALACVDYDLVVGADRRRHEGRLLPVKKRSAAAQKVLLIVRDITDRKRAEDALRIRETQYRSLVEGSANGMCIHKDFVVQFANRSLARLLGYQEGYELVGTDIRKHLPDHHSAEEHEDANRLRGSAIPGRHDYQARRSDGTLVPVSALVSSIHWRGKRATLLTINEGFGAKRG